MNNALQVIFPYWKTSTWVFDDAAVGPKAEPFVFGMPEMISPLVANTPDADKGFALYFSAQPFPGLTVKLDWVREEFGGNWYRLGESEGWLCPALFQYFSEAPRALYAKAEAFKRPGLSP
jgi:hypothetical protein